MIVYVSILSAMVRHILSGRPRRVHRNVALWVCIPLLLGLFTPVGAQDLDAVLVKDINTIRVRGGLLPRNFTIVGSKLFFTELFRGLWVTDGTLEGSLALPIDFPLEGSPNSLADAGGTLYFNGQDETGRELWKSDGTRAGTVRVKDINPAINPVGSSNPGGFLDVGGTILFMADDGVHGRELWKTDGTEEGTTLAVDIVPGPDTGSPSQLTVGGDLLFFSLTTSFNPLHDELWRTDGTEAGTALVKDINPTGYSAIRALTTFDGEFFFTADDGSGQALWKSDGTEAGTVNLGIAGTSQTFRSRTQLNGAIYYMANRDAVPGDELWKLDLTSAEEAPVSDINWIFSPVHAQVQSLGSVGDVLYFSGDDGTTGDELWRHDPSTGVTEPITDFNPPGSNSFRFGTFVDVEGTLFFPGGPLADRQIWTSDGTAAGTTEIIINPSGLSFPFSFHPGEITSFDGSLFFGASGEPSPDVVTGLNEEVWRTDGTQAGTIEFPLGGERTFGSDPLLKASIGGGGGGIVVGSEFYFAANDQAFVGGDDPDPENVELWKTDGTECGTVKVADIHPEVEPDPGDPFNSSDVDGSFPSALTEVDGAIYFTADDATTGIELWRHVPASGITERLTDLNPGDGNAFSGGGNIVRIGRVLFFQARDASGSGIWRYEIDTGDAEMLVDTGFPELIPLGNLVIFRRPDGMWMHDADTGVTEQFTTDRFDGHVVLGDEIFFKTGPEPALWKTDGTTAGTVEIDPDLQSPLTNNIATLAGAVYYIKGQAEPELWRHDPVADTTEQVVDLFSIGLSAVNPNVLLEYDSRLFFDASGPGGSSLYAFDPVTEAVELIADPQPFDNTVTGLLTEPTIVADMLYFIADPHRSGAIAGFTELWRSDGTPAGTGKVPVSNLESIKSLVDFNGTVLFTATFAVDGRSFGGEVYRLGGSAACDEDTDAPSVSGVLATPNPVFVGDPTVLSATGDDSASGGSTIASAAYSVDGGPPMPMDAADGAFDSAVEDVTATLSFDEPGEYELCVTVTDAAGNTSAPVCTLLTAEANVPPNANAGDDQEITLGEVAFLDGTDSNDPDNGPQALTFSWQFVSVPLGSTLTDTDIAGADTGTPNFTPDVEGAYVLELEVFDGKDNAFDHLTVTVQGAPEPSVCDLDGSEDVDVLDIGIILQHRNEPADRCPECDIDEDGFITVLDARKCVLECTRAGCAID